MSNVAKESQTQRSYYAETAAKYDSMHVDDEDEHYFALSFMVAALDFLQATSVLDVGSGTGRAVLYLKQHCPDVRVVGVEPVKELREIGYSNGLSKDELIDGDATHIDSAAEDFDLTCAFGVLHHIRTPENAISEMLRVSKKAIFISDSNNFGHGSLAARTIKQLIDLVGLWSVANIVKTKGKGYIVSEGDGLSYSYSVFNNYRQIQEHCKRIHILNTRDGHINPYRTASHVALLGIKK